MLKLPKQKTKYLVLYRNTINRNFQGGKYQTKIRDIHVFLLYLDSIIKVDKKYYLQALFEDCKNEIKKKKLKSLMSGDLYSSDDNEPDDKADNESGDEFNAKSDGKSSDQENAQRVNK